MQKYWPEKRYRDKDSIWLALNRVNQQEVILKFFPMDRSDEYKVSREAYTMRYLFNEDPKHFLELYDYLEDSNENQYTIAMEKAECSLEDVVTERGFISEEEAIPVIRELLYAIQVMHKNNFIHRDLKLSNILLRNKNDLSSVTIIDFGETVDRTEEYYISGIVGTLHYMAPEILKKKKYYKPVDIWALGVISYRLLTGYFPYITEGDNHSKQLKAILNNEVSYLRYDNVRLSNKAIDFINCLLEVDPMNRMNIQTALDHPFLNPEFEGEFVPYKPIPKFSKKMAKDNVQDGTVIKRLLTRAVRKNKKQNQAAESEKVINTLFSKNRAETEPNDENNTEEDEKESNIHYSKTCVQPRRNDPFMGGTQTIDRMHMKHHQYEEVPPYLNITLGRNNSHNSQNHQYNNIYADEENFDNVKYSNTYVPPTGNTAGNIDYNNYNNSDEYVPPTGNTAGNYNEQYNNNGYSNNYAPYGNNNNNNNNSNNNNNNYLSPKLPKTAGNSIDPYANSYDEYPQNSNQNNGYSANPNMNNNNYSNPNMNNNNYSNSNMNNNNYSNSNMNNYQKSPKTAGNSIDPYGNFQNVNMPTKMNKKYDDYPNYSVKNQFAERYGNEIKKSNTVNGPSTKSKNSPSHDQPSTKSDDYRHYRRDNDSVHSHHRKTSSSGSRQSYERDQRRYDHDYDSDRSRHRYDDDSQSRHRKTNSAGSRPRYDDDSGHHRRTSSGSRPRYDDDDEIYGRHRSESSPSRPYVAPLTALNSSTKDNHNKPYSSKRPSPLVNATTIKNSNAVDNQNKLKNKESEVDSKESKSSKIKEKTKNILPMGIKLKIDARPMKLPPVISNHPARNSSLKNKK